jgi:cytidyltransferase-like protein
MVDPVFTEMAKEKYNKKSEEKPSDFLGLTIMDIMNFILEEGVESFNVSGDTDDERYISFISDVFVKFLGEYAYKYRGADFQEPDYLRKDEFRLNLDMIKDKRVLKYLDTDDSYESLFKLMLNSFRKIRKRASGIITTGIIDQFNIVVSNIERIVTDNRKPSIQESESVPSFMDFKKSNLSSKKIDYVTSELDESGDELEDVDDPFYSYNEFISTLETIDTTKKDKSKEIKEEGETDKNKLEPVNLLVGRFQPFHNGHMKMVDQLYKENDLPSIIAVVHPGHNKSGKSPYDEKLISRYMEGIVRDNPGKISGYFVVNRGLLGPIYGKAKEYGFLTKSIAAGDDRIEDYNKQAEYLKKTGGDFPDDIKIIQTKRSSSGSDVRKKIESEDYTGFKKLVPQAVANVYNSLIDAQRGNGIKEEEEIIFHDSNLVAESETQEIIKNNQ